MGYPELLKCKPRNDSNFNGSVRHGVEKANKTDANHLVLYQTYMELTENPALFTVINKNNSGVYYELVTYNKALVQEASDRAVNILTASKAGDILTRIARGKYFCLLKFCEVRVI